MKNNLLKLLFGRIYLPLSKNDPSIQSFTENIENENEKNSRIKFSATEPKTNSIDNIRLHKKEKIQSFSENVSFSKIN